MIKAIKIRLYPNKEQREMIANHFGCCRFVYNEALSYKKIIYNKDKTKVSKYDLFKRLTLLKQQEDKLWLNSIKVEVLQNSIANLDVAFIKFFKGKGYPKFKKKTNNQTFTSTQNLTFLKNVNKVRFLGQKIKFKTSKEYIDILHSSKIKSITYSKNTANQYFASVLIETEKIKILPEVNKEIGIDLGIKHFLVTSDNEIVENPKFAKNLQHKLTKVQRQLSRKVKGSNNRKKTKLKIAKVYLKIKNSREHFLHQVTNKLIDENQIIHLEILSILNMQKNVNLAFSIADASWYEFKRILKYKANWYGRNIYEIDRYAATSKTCSICGKVKEDLNLADRVFICECGHMEDRDLNAAKNIKNFSRVELARINASGEQVNRHSLKEEGLKIDRI